MGKAKRAHQFHDARQWQSFEDGRQINFREKDREKNLSPQTTVPSALCPAVILPFVIEEGDFI